MKQTDKTGAGRTLGVTAIVAIWLAGVMGGLAADGPAAEKTWTLATEDTELTLAVASNTLSIVKLRNPAQDWNWTPNAATVPMPILQGKADLKWEFRDATETKTDGDELTLRFTCAEPALEMRSVWRALPGPGPVENEVGIVNKSEGNVVFDKGIAAARIALVTDAGVTLHRADKTAAGKGRVYEDVIAPSKTYATHAGIIPLVILQAGSKHGFYLGFEWELGGVSVTSQADPLRLTASVHPITENVPRSKGEELLIPSVYYGVYQGDIDDGANRFKRWFWNHKLTRSLRDNAGEPWVEVCMQELGGNGSSSITGKTPQNSYDRIAATGVECVKMDFWDGTGQCWYRNRDWQFQPAVWPDGFNFARKAHKAGMKASLYMGGTYNDCDLNTTASRDAELEAVLWRYDQGWFDMWRTDRYTAPKDPMPGTYQGVLNFLYIQDQLIRNRPGYRYENCCNGGPYKGFAICRRMTFCTMNDIDQDPVATRTTHYSCTYGVNPVQLKSDLGPAQTPYEMRTHMLGAILSWATDNPVYRQHIALYKSRQRPILRGANVYHILPMADGVNWDGLQYFNPDLNRGSVFLFKPSAKAVDGDSKVTKLKGLDRKATYSLAFQDRANLNCVATGAQLMDHGITVSGMTGDRASEIIWINPGPEFSASPGQLSFRVANRADRAPPAQVSISYREGPGPDKAFSIRAADPWLKIEGGSSAGDGQTFAVSVAPADMPDGIYRSKVVISRPDIPDRIEVPVCLRFGTPTLRIVTINPPSGRCIANEQQRFSLTAQDQFGEPFPAPIQWSVSGGGKMDDQGIFRSDGTTGTFTVTASVKGQPAGTATAQLKVLSVNLARWKLDETNGTVAADAWGNFPGTLVGGPARVAGKRNGALRLNGKGQYMDTQWNLEGLQLPCTFAFWVNPAATQCEYADIFGNHEGSTVGLVMQQEGAALNKYSFGYGSSPAPGTSGPVQLTANEWQHVAAVCDGKDVILYRNGKETTRGPGKNPITPNPGLNFRLGSGFSHGRFFNGALDDFRIYARALSVEEVQAVMRE